MNRMDAPCGLLSRHLLFIAMEGLPLDVILLVSIGLVAAVSLAAYLARKFGSNGNQEGSPSGGGGGGAGDGTNEVGGTAPGRLARHPGGECPICLSVEVETPVQTNCGHWFCARCILGYYDELGRVRIKCPICRQEVNMLHGAAEDTAAGATSAVDAAAAQTATGGSDAPTAPAVAPPRQTPTSPETQERIVRFNERSTRRRRSPWQVVEDAPLLLRRLWSDVRRGDTQVFRELIRRGVQLQLFMVVLYILSPVDFFPESLLGIAGLLDDLFVVIILVLHITTVYRTILLSWERSRAARAAAASTATPDAPPETASPFTAVVGPAEPGRFDNSPLGAVLAAGCAVLVASLATFAGAGSGASAIAAGAMGIAAAAASSAPPDARNIPPLARDR